MSNLDRRPPRLHFVNLETGEEMDAQFNPTEFEKTIPVNVQRREVPGLSHQPIQFASTGNMTIPIELYLCVETRAELLYSVQVERFFESLCYPSAGAGDVATGGLPRLLVVWPQNFAFVAMLTSGLRVRTTRFNVFGNGTEKTLSFVCEEARDYRLTSEDVRSNGANRAPTATETFESWGG